MPQKNLVLENFIVDKKARRENHNHYSFVLWFTGLSGSGKSTIAKKLEYELHKKGYKTYALDGDNIRQGLNKDLEFSAPDRKENIRRVAEVAKLFVDAGVIITASFISPYKSERIFARKILESDEFIEIYVKASIQICEQRDTKGFYKKTREGTIKGFTGIDDPYEEPDNPDILINSEILSPKEAVDKIINYLKTNNFL